MSLIRLNKAIPRFKTVIARTNTKVALNNDEYTDTPIYPPILDLSFKAKKLRDRQVTYDKIKSIKTVEEKQIALNIPRYYGWKCVMMNEDKVPYNALPLVKYYTRSHFEPIEKLPQSYDESSNFADEVVKQVKGFVEDALVLEKEVLERRLNFATDLEKDAHVENSVAKNIVRHINRIITNNLVDKIPHILSTQVDESPRHEAFWFLGGVEVPQNVKMYRWKNTWLRKRLNENLDRPIQYIGTPLLTLRNENPLKPIRSHEEAINPDVKVEKFPYYPENSAYFANYRHGTNIPGFWPGDSDEFGAISFHGRGHILSRNPSFGPEDDIEALHCQAILGSFGWLLAQANYQGFTTYNDVTYPLATQTVVTNGKLWSFYLYQLDTIVMHNENASRNPKHNICFGTKPMQLYDQIENGKVKGLNEEVLKMLVQLYLNAPAKRDYEMKPYLGKDEQVVADIEEDNRRIWLEEKYKHIASNRPRHLLAPEVYMWEKIYKIDFDTRFNEAKRRPFELGVNPYQRRLDEHLPPYIPKVKRPYPRSRKKFEPTYYPDV